MLNESVAKDRIVAAALKLAAERPWNDVTLREIAEAAGMGLVELRREVASKGAILAAFTRAADDAVLARAAKPAPGQPARDRLFDVIMTRFDVLAPYKAGLKSIAATRPFDMTLMQKLCSSQAWMLHAAGIGTEGPLGPVRVVGLGSVYASVFSTWLDDDDPGHAKTMAALDRRLKRGEQTMSTLSDMCSAACRLIGRGKPDGQKGASSSTPSSTTGDGADAARDMGYGRA